MITRRNALFAALGGFAATAAASPRSAGARTFPRGSRPIYRPSAVRPGSAARGSTVMLNPQPLPPRWTVGRPGSAVMLNPQPLPPRWTVR